MLVRVPEGTQGHSNRLNSICRTFNRRTLWLYCTLQKWSKGKVRDKLNNLAMFDKVTYDKLYKEVPSYKLITPAVVSERLKIRASLARKALEELEAKGLIKQVYIEN